MNRILLLIVMVVAGQFHSAHAQSAVPADMERLRTAYEAARERVTRPLDEKYLAELVKLQGTYTKAAKLQEALAVADEIKGMKERMDLAGKSKSSGHPASSTAAKGAKETTVTIPANTPNGYRLGAVQRGDTITLVYVSGKWKSRGGSATETPDDPKATYGEADRLVIAEAADASGAPGKVIAIVSPETTLKPFTHLVQESCSEVVLRININSERKENPGEVIYKLKVSH